MAIKSVVPESKLHWLELRANNVNSTEVSILFGLNKYKSLFQYWHEKKSILVEELDLGERVKWGSRLEDSIARGAAEDLQVVVRKAPEYIYDDELRMGSSFDYFIIDVTDIIAIGKPIDVGILEIKNVDPLIFKSEWIIDADDNGFVDIQATPQIELQLQAQLAMTGFQYGYIAALIGGNTLKLIKRDRDEEVIAHIRDAVKRFWESIDNNQPPAIDYETDSEYIISRFGHAEPGTIMDLSDNAMVKDLALQYKLASDSIKALDGQKEGLKAQILQIIGSAEKAKGDGFSISAGLIGPAEMNFTRQGYRQFKINWPRKKKE